MGRSIVFRAVFSGPLRKPLVDAMQGENRLTGAAYAKVEKRFESTFNVQCRRELYRHAAKSVWFTCALLGLASLAAAQAPPPSAFPGVAPQGPPADILVFEAEPSDIQPGDTARLRWDVTNAFALSIQPDVGIVGTRGTIQLSPGATTTYVLEADGSGGTVSKSLTVRVAGTETRVSGRTSENLGSLPVPRLADGRPDLSGLYIGGRDVRLAGEITLAPGADRVQAATKASDLGQGVNCLPPGVPAATMMPFPLQIVQKPDVIAIMYEAYHLFRIIPIGKPQDDYLAPAWMGHSVAHWDGDTLVVEVAGFNDRTLIGGHPHTEDMRVIERYTRVSYDTIEYRASVEDPAVFAEPVRYAGNLTLHQEWEIGEYFCTENDKDYDALFEN